MECPHCKKQYERETLLKHLMVCPDCGCHMRMDVPDRIAYIADKDTFEELDPTLRTMNPIQMAGYEEKVSAAEAKTSMNEAVVTGKCKIEGRDALLGVMSFDFLGGAAERIPVIIYATSGGARMQEGLFSLMQMAKTSSAAAELDDKGVPLFLMLCDPTTGGVTASFAMLGDVIAAEPNALIGFAGPRVIEGTIHQQLPEGFQRAEFQLKKGFVDCIVPRIEQKHFFAVMIDAHMNPPFGKGRR